MKIEIKKVIEKHMPLETDFGAEKPAKGTPKIDPGDSKMDVQGTLGPPVREHTPIYAKTALPDHLFGGLGPHFWYHV